ncbi:MAG: NAD(P)-dependent oxidoreductase [Neomegalonema sp.]|nr:NAD(P)-dependent oxidoreductase [Neomegalonema sp.]
MKIGFLGLGAMGAPMLKRLSEAHPGATIGFDANDAVAIAACTAATTRRADDIGSLVAESDVIFSCLPNNDVLRTVYLGPDGVVSALRPGAITIDCSTVGPDATRDVYEGVKAQGGSHLDASMLGSVKQATEGTISFVVGGDQNTFDRAKPALAACGQMIRYCGPTGAGNKMKLVHQTLVAGHAVAVAEALGLCLETGVKIEDFYDIVTKGTGFAYSRYFENRTPRMREGDFSPLFMLKFMLKDARLARDMAPNAANYPALAAVIETLEDADAQGWGDDDFSAAMKTVESRIGRGIAK